MHPFPPRRCHDRGPPTSLRRFVSGLPAHSASQSSEEFHTFNVGCKGQRWATPCNRGGVRGLRWERGVLRLAGVLGRHMDRRHRALGCRWAGGRALTPGGGGKDEGDRKRMEGPTLCRQDLGPQISRHKYFSLRNPPVLCPVRRLPNGRAAFVSIRDSARHSRKS